MNTEVDLLKVKQTEKSEDLTSQQARDETTQTIDVSNMFKDVLVSDGDFDLGKIPFTALGRLLDALPIPALLVDSHYRLIFSNNSIEQLGSDKHKLQGILFTDLLARSNNAEKSKVLINKTEWMLKKAFTARQPQQAETILCVLGSKRWCRLHFRTIRVLSTVYMLILAEDITSERIENHVKRKEEFQLKKKNADLQKQIDDLKLQLCHLKNKFRYEVVVHKKTKQQMGESDSSKKCTT